MPKTTFAFTVEGLPAPAGSKTVGHTKAGHAYVYPACKRTKAWMELVRTIAAIEYGKRQLMTGAIELKCNFYFKRPKSHYRTGRFRFSLREDAPLYHLTVPDLTKLVRAIEDALKGVIWTDDSHVVSQHNSKQYSHSSLPGAVVTITEFDK